MSHDNKDGRGYQEPKNGNNGKGSNRPASAMPQMNEKERRNLKKTIKELGEIKGRHTELVSVYIKSGYTISDMITRLKEEQGTASNIKSKTTRKNVMAALGRVVEYLKKYDKTPENGLVIFSGNVSENEGKEDIQIFPILPPEKLTTNIYWCDQKFVLDPLMNMIRETELYGLVILDARDANIGLLSGKTIKPLKHIDSTVPSKTVKGGMSQHRYDRIREDAIHEFLTKVGEVANELLLKEELKGIVIGGPGPVKERFANGKYLNYQLLKLVLGVKDIGYTNDYGFQELVERSEDLLAESAILREKELLQRFFTGLQKDGLVTYGIDEVKRALEAGAVDTLLISEDFDWVRVKYVCQCGEQAKKDVPKKRLKDIKCEKCGSWMKPDKQEMIGMHDLLEEQALNTGAKVETVSVETNEGFQFKELGGVGAILRFKI